MDLQKVISAMVATDRAARFGESNQLSLGELILKLEAVQDKNKKIVLDFGKHPTGLDSWRGIYAELAINFDDASQLTAQEFFDLCKEAVGKEYEGYKGGEFVMHRQTPIWVANYGNSGIDCEYKDKTDYINVGVTGISELEDEVVILTEEMES